MKPALKPLAVILLGVLATLGLVACFEGSDGKRGPAGPPGPSGGSGSSGELGKYDDLPGVVVEILNVGPVNDAGPNAQVADQLQVRFTLAKGDGSALPIEELNYGAVMVSGPSSNYQPVIHRQTDLIAAAKRNGDGSYTYTTPPLPAVYPAPLNDTTSLGFDEGELQGLPLESGTYTMCLEVYKTYTIEQESFRDPGTATFDFLFGKATQISSREVVKVDNCNQCHTQLRAHGTFRRNVTQCLMCHTAGAEDGNNAAVAGGTPGVTIEFGVMIHRIHNGKHLPSVLGVTTVAGGKRDYTATPQPYLIAGRGTSLHDYSEVAFPQWPNLSFPMPRDAGHSTTLGSTEQGLEDSIRSGVTSCASCHGDPDGSGPLSEPAQGHLAFEEPTRKTCGSCHDDVVWDFEYVSNNFRMPPQADDNACTLCHPRGGDFLSVEDAHLHPMLNPDFNPGLRVELLAVEEAGAHNGDGTLDPGEKLSASFNLTDDAGQAVSPSSLSGFFASVAGPLHNRNLLLYTPIPTAALTGAPPYTLMLPEPRWLEFLGDAQDPDVESFTTRYAPHWNLTGARTTVYARTGSAGLQTALTAMARAGDNYVDVLNGTLFARNDFVVFDDGLATEEYVKIALVDGNRLWFQSDFSFGTKAGLVYDHLAGAALEEVTLQTKVEGVDYSIDLGSGKITELNTTAFPTGGAVLATYTTDFVLPDLFPAPANNSGDLDERNGEWAGKPIADGTYTAALWGSRSLTFSFAGENTSYRSTAPPATSDFLVGAAATLAEYDLISSAANCYSCHTDIYFHGGQRRGYESCIQCHSSGAEDRPRFIAANAPPTTGVTIDFRTMLHKIHRGAELAQGADYKVVGFGSAAYPDNYTAHSYEEVEFPSMVGGVGQCVSCHGTGNTSWTEPGNRAHPTAAALPTQEWRAVCNSCHDSSAATAHIDVQTSLSGAESCAVCHGPGKDLDVQLMHKNR